MMYRQMSFLVITFFVLGVSGKAFAENPLYKTYLDSGWEARKVKNYEEAEKSYTSAARLNPQASEPKVGLLYTYMENSDFIRAEVIAEQCLKSDPDNLWVRKAAAWVFYNQKRYDDAIVQYSWVLQEEGEDPTMKLGLGLSQYYAGRREEARETCLECQDDFDENDERVILCLGETDREWKEEMVDDSTKEWRFTPRLYFTYTDYSESITKESAETITTSLEILHRYGLGFYLQGSGMMYSEKESGDRCYQYSTSCSLFYSMSDIYLWVNGTRLTGDYEGEESAEAFSLYGSGRFDMFHFGIERSKGKYDGFETIQYKPEFGLYLGDHYFLTLNGMIQDSSLDEDSIAEETAEETENYTEMKKRSSIGLDLSATYDFCSLSLSGYYGERWFTVEDRGLNIWNGDEEFEWGGKLNLNIHRNKNRTYYITVRGDKVNMQSGLENEFYITGVTTGITLNF